MNPMKYLLPKLHLNTFAEEGAPAGGVTPAPTPGSGDMTPTPSGQDDNKTVPLAALHEERTKRQELQSELESLRTVLQETQARTAQPPYQQQQYAQQQYQQPPQANVGAQLEAMWEEDPRKAVNAQIGQAFAYYDQVNAYVEAQISQAATKYQDFSQYQDQIRRYVNATPIADRARPGVVDVAYYIAKGQNADAIAEQARQAAAAQAGAAIGVQGVGPGVPAAPTPAAQAGTLTQEEQSVARVMGLTDEEYLANKR